MEPIAVSTLVILAGLYAHFKATQRESLFELHVFFRLEPEGYQKMEPLERESYTFWALPTLGVIPRQGDWVGPKNLAKLPKEESFCLSMEVEKVELFPGTKPQVQCKTIRVPSEELQSTAQELQDGGWSIKNHEEP